MNKLQTNTSVQESCTWPEGKKKVFNLFNKISIQKMNKMILT